MTYVGRGVDAISNVEKLDNITFNGGTTYALTKSSAAFTPVGANNLLVSIDGVIQQGNFSVSTTNIVFDWSPTSSNTNNFILHYGTGVLNVPADGSIVAAKMAANSVDSDAYVDGSIDAVHLSANSVDSDSYVDLSIDTAHIGATQVTGAKLNTDVISAQTALAVAPADTDEFMVSDGGVLKRIDYSLIKGGDNTPSFYAYHSSAQTIANNTTTVVILETESFDTDSAYNTSDGKFTVPAGAAGKYYFGARVYFTVADASRVSAELYKNNSAIALNRIHGSYANTVCVGVDTIVDCSATDYITFKTDQSSGSSQDTGTGISLTSFFGFKLI